jgi:hypothetical protein
VVVFIREKVVFIFKKWLFFFDDRSYKFEE